MKAGKAQDSWLEKTECRPIRARDLGDFALQMAGRYGGTRDAHFKAARKRLKSGKLTAVQDGNMIAFGPAPASTPVSASSHFGLTTAPQGAMA